MFLNITKTHGTYFPRLENNFLQFQDFQNLYKHCFIHGLPKGQNIPADFEQSKALNIFNTETTKLHFKQITAYLLEGQINLSLV